MPRKYRVEFPNARYHLINRGNFRFDVFADEATKAAFESCLFKACEEWSWVLNGFTIMRNHFHLAVRTPEANVVRGMHWLESTFANRFNRFRGENGHLFQGRYTALVIGDEKSLGDVCDYIHLNPAAAGIMSMATLPEYRYSSYWYWYHQRPNPHFLDIVARVGSAGQVSTDVAGRDLYVGHLTQELEEGRRNPRRYLRLTRGWAIGSDAFKAQLVEQFRPALAASRAWTLDGAKFIRAAVWEKELKRVLGALGHSEDEARQQVRSEPWKLAVATWLRERYKAKNKWLSERLGLGAPSVVSRNLARFRTVAKAEDPTWRAIMSIFAA